MTLDQVYKDAKELLEVHRGQLELVAGELLKNETLDRDTFMGLIGLPAKQDGEGKMPVEAAPEEVGQL